MDIVYFAVVVSVLIFVHELGHFIWAKAFGVKVLMFSIGFGPKLLRIRGRETEYCVGILPLGGYVKMLEENRQEPVLPEDKHRTFEAQAPWKRAVIVMAGPAASILFPFCCTPGSSPARTSSRRRRWVSCCPVTPPTASSTPATASSRSTASTSRRSPSCSGR